MCQRTEVRRALSLNRLYIKNGDTLDTLTLRDYRSVSPAFDEDVYQALMLNTCVNGRLVYGGPARDSVVKQIALIEEFVEARA